MPVPDRCAVILDMADITRRATKKLREHLEPGEVPEVAILAEPDGTYGLGMVALAALPRTAGRALADRATDRNEAEGGLAAFLPGEPCALVLTGHRLLAVPTNGLRWREPAFVVPRGQVKVDESGGRLLGRRLGLVFADGSRARFDVQRGQPIERFIESVGSVPPAG